MDRLRLAQRLGIGAMVCVLLVGAPMAAMAQLAGRADSITVSLWPEFDRREVLVIIRVELEGTTPLPTRFAVPIPAGATELTAVAYRDDRGQLLNASHERLVGDLHDTVVVETSGLEVHLEYYAPLSIEGDLRTFTFTWPGGLAAGRFGFEVQQPFGSEEMEVEPAATGRTTDARGLTYQVVDLGPIGAEARPEVTFRYRKTSPELSADVSGPPPVLAPATPAAPAPFDVGELLPYLLLVAGAGAVAFGVISFLRTRSRPRARPRHRPAAARKEDDREVDASPVFCHSCGAQASASDRFCRRCGTALRA